MKNNLKFFSILLLAASTILANKQATAQSAAPPCSSGTINLSTGVSTTGTLLAAGSADPNWLYPAGMGTVVAPYAGWSTLAGSGWIGNYSAATYTNFTYTRTFNIPSSGTMTFQALADNNVVIKLDGVQIAQTPGGSTYGFQTANMASYTGPVTAGAHTLTAIVHNDALPSGLNLSGSVTYCSGTTPPPVCIVTANYTAAYGGLNKVNFSSSAGSSGTGYTVSHSWSFGDGTTSSIANPLHLYSGPGTYYVTHSVTKNMLGTNGQVLSSCSDINYCRVILSNSVILEPALAKRIATGPAPEKQEQMIILPPGGGSVTVLCGIAEARIASLSGGVMTLAPNPAKNEVIISGNGAPLDDIQVFSLDGRQVLHIKGITEENTKLDIAGLTPGAYVVKITQSNNVTNLKFIKSE